MGWMDRLFVQRGRLGKYDAREAERQALINDLTEDRIQNPRYGAEPTNETISSGYASASAAIRVADSPTTTTGTSWYVSVFLVVNAALGAGLLNFPHAFHAAGGVETALSVQVVLLTIACVTLVILAYCADMNKSETYQDVIRSCLGSKFHILCSFCIAIYCYGCCITFLIIIGDQWDRFFYSYNKSFCHVVYTSRPFTTIASSLLFILPLCYPRRIDFLKYISAAGVAAIFYIDFLQVWKYYTGDYDGQRGKIRHGPDRWTDIFLVAPTIFFGYQCHISAIPIYYCLKGRSTTTFLKTALTAMFICMLTYSVAAVYGYWTFGGNVSDDVLENYNPKDPWVLVAMIAITFKTFTSYPLLSFCGRTGVDSLWVRLRGLSDLEQTDGERGRRIVQATTWFFSSVALAIFIPGVDIVISFLGGLAATFIVVFPGLCLIQVSLEKRERSTNLPGSSDTSHLSTQLSSLQNDRKFTFSMFLTFVMFGSFLVVFGMFIFGIIIANSCMTKPTKVPLCI